MKRDPAGFPGHEGVPHRQFATAYEQGTPAWCIGRPQPVVSSVVDRGWFTNGPFLDAGCGTGENLIEIIGRHPGLQGLGVDSVPAAVRAAGVGVRAAGLEDRVELEVVDLRKTFPAGPFRTILDAGVLHVFSDADRRRYLSDVARALLPGGEFVVVVFSDSEIRPGGPRRIGRDELDAGLTEAGLEVLSIEECRYWTTTWDDGAAAWLARARRPEA